MRLRNLLIAISVVSIGTVFLYFNKTANTPVANHDVLGEVTIAPTEEPTQTVDVTPTPETTSGIEVTVTPSEDADNSNEAPIDTSTSTPTPKPTEEPFLNVVSIKSKPPKVITTGAGQVIALEFNDLNPNTLYQIDLSLYNSLSLAISWPKLSSLDWSTTENTKKSELQAIPLDDDEMEGDENQYSGLLDTPSSKFIYVYPHSSIGKITVSLIDPATITGNVSIQSTGIYNSDSGASYTSLPIVTRDQWGANPASWDSHSNTDIDSPLRLVWYPVYYKVRRIIVHHTATIVSSTNPASSVRAIYLYHAYTRGWGDIGYNFLIDQNGTIYEGKGGGDETQGYHAFGSANRISVGISMMGDFTNSPPTAKAQSALIKLLAEKAAFYGFALKYSDGGTSKWLDSSYTVFGHRTSYRWYDSSSSWGTEATACPGNSFAPILPALVKSADNYRMNNYTQIKQLVTDVEKSFAQPHELGTLLVRYDVPDTTPESTMQSYVPFYSGIDSYTIDGNTITYRIVSKIITHPDSAPGCTTTCDTEYVLPPMGWDGYSHEYATFSIPFVLNGPEDRTKTLLKIFRLDPRVKSADLKTYSTIQ